MSTPRASGESSAARTRGRPAASPRTIRRMFLLAAGLGTLHALPSFYWALGGEWLLPLVGRWAFDAMGDGDLSLMLLLLVTGLLKLAAAWVPLLAEEGRIPWRQMWRVISWAGGAGLVLYGSADVVLGGLVLTGAVDVEITDRPGLLGHTLLWGPHFMLWGLMLLVALVLSRRRPDRRPRHQRRSGARRLLPGGGQR
ncbi:DUF3995 domain-containing protein [Nesterenkonia suensis]